MILIDFNWLKIKYPVTALWRLSGIHEALTRAVSVILNSININ